MRSSKKDEIILIGSGAQGRVTLDILEDSGFKVIGFLDDKDSLQGVEISKKKIIGKTNNAMELSERNYRFIICIGNNRVRKEVSEKIEIKKSSYGNAIHASSVILKSASVGCGNMIFANTYIGSNTQIKNHTIINNGCVIEHDSVLEDFVSISPGCCMAGRVTIREGAFISAGVTVGPRVIIGANSIIGAGSVVLKDIPEGVLAYGVPAKVIRKVNPEELWDRLL